VCYAPLPSRRLQQQVIVVTTSVTLVAGKSRLEAVLAGHLPRDLELSRT
jgi:hypothetical protein